MTMPNRRTTTERGLGWEHQKQRRRLLANHLDGTPCPCLDDGDCGPACLCRPIGKGQPMYRDAYLNPDGKALEADHSIARSQGGKKADRLMLHTCNRSRGDGMRGGELDRYAAPWWTRDWSSRPS